MFKKLAILCLAVSMAPIALANGGMPPAPAFFNGFFVGGALNGANVYSQVTSKQFDAAGAYQGKAVFNPGYDTLGFTLFGSYGRTLADCWYLGAVLHARYLLNNSKYAHESKDADGVTSEQYAKLYQDWNFGLSAQLGWLPQMFAARNVMLYALLGVEYARFTMAKNQYDINTYGDKASKWLWGFAPGLGLMVAVTQNLAVNAQYVYTFFSNFSRTDQFAAGNSNKWSMNQIRTAVFSLGLSYKLPWNV